MYHDNQSYTLEIPDSLANITRAVVVAKDGKQYLQLEAELREDQKFDGSTGTPRLHLTNGVNHHYIDLKTEEAEAEPEARKGKK